MSPLLVCVLLLAIGLVAYFIGRTRAVRFEGGRIKPHSRAHYQGWWALLLVVVPSFLFLALGLIGSAV